MTPASQHTLVVYRSSYSILLYTFGLILLVGAVHVDAIPILHLIPTRTTNLTGPTRTTSSTEPHHSRFTEDLQTVITSTASNPMSLATITGTAASLGRLVYAAVETSWNSSTLPDRFVLLAGFVPIVNGSMPEENPGDGSYPMTLEGALIILGALVLLTLAFFYMFSVLGKRRDGLYLLSTWITDSNMPTLTRPKQSRKNKRKFDSVGDKEGMIYAGTYDSSVKKVSKTHLKRPSLLDLPDDVIGKIAASLPTKSNDYEDHSQTDFLSLSLVNLRLYGIIKAYGADFIEQWFITHTSDKPMIAAMARKFREWTISTYKRYANKPNPGRKWLDYFCKPFMNSPHYMAFKKRITKLLVRINEQNGRQDDLICQGSFDEPWMNWEELLLGQTLLYYQHYDPVSWSCLVRHARTEGLIDDDDD
ncbi:hypothetical protein BJ508DRAFT_314701 [Ascobolus immersus RN42]|uniref:Uncharacterized protein n=1 Tax=Ascobolus immersus RN42 TaxID=1160509 RepID=A0A3N4HKU1_ASCIM|nr:hypothetical protein BJ508DRAFT_314701 [Ascobolus immersus RN42]